MEYSLGKWCLVNFVCFLNYSKEMKIKIFRLGIFFNSYFEKLANPLNDTIFTMKVMNWIKLLKKKVLHVFFILLLFSHYFPLTFLDIFSSRKISGNFKWSRRNPVIDVIFFIKLMFNLFPEKVLNSIIIIFLNWSNKF